MRKVPKKVARALETLRNPGGGLKLVSHGWVSRKDSARDEVARAVRQAREAGLDWPSISNIAFLAYEELPADKETGR